MNVEMNKNMMNLSRVHQQLSTGKRINSAADDASGLAINEKLLKEINGLDKGTENTMDMQNLVRTAEGGLDTISSNLQRIRELSVQASNGIYTDSDKALMQEEVGQLLDEIERATQGTEFNSMKLLDGSFANKNTASSPDGTGMLISIEDTSLATLGIAGYDLTGSFDISDIDNALNMVNDARAKIGVQYNRLEYTVNANEISSLNLKAAKSRIADKDMAKGVMELHQANVKQQYQIFMQKKEMNKQVNQFTYLT